MTGRSFDLSDRVALVSGASGSLGSAVTHALADAGAAVAVTGRDRGGLEALANEINGRGGVACAVAGDPNVEADVSRVCATVERELGPIGILITAAGMNRAAPIVDQPVEDWEAVVDSQLRTTWLLCKEVGRRMIDHGEGGKVVLVGSQRGSLGMAGYTAYSPAKAAVHLLAKSLACEWGQHHINVNCVAPGLFRSALTEWMWTDDEVHERMLARIPIGRLGEPEDCVGAVLFLASSMSDWVTGSVIAVDGGYTAG